MRWPRKETIREWETWRRWFAWYPITVDGQAVWLEIIERKGTQYCGYDQCIIEWEYRLLGACDA